MHLDQLRSPMHLHQNVALNIFWVVITFVHIDLGALVPLYQKWITNVFFSYHPSTAYISIDSLRINTIFY